VGVSIPISMRHVARDGHELARATSSADATSEVARVGIGHLERFTQFVEGHEPTALQHVRDGLELVVDERMVDDAVGGSGSALLGRAGTLFRGEPIDHPAVVGHELTHALEFPTGNFPVFELNADLVGLAYARSIGAGHRGEDAWNLGLIPRDLRHPDFPTMDALHAAGLETNDTHTMAGPVGAAIARAGDRLGLDVVDGITTKAVLRDLPRTDAAVSARMFDTIDQHDLAGSVHRTLELALRDEADGLLAAAARVHGRGSDEVRVLRDELVRSGIVLD
jgi:hypothetical protein